MSADVRAVLEGLKAGWDSCKSQDDQKHSLISVWKTHVPTTGAICSLRIQDLFAYIQDLSGKLSDAESELRDKKDVIKMARDRVDEGERKLQVLQFDKVNWMPPCFFLWKLTFAGPA